VIKEVEFEAELLGERAYYSWTAKGKRGRALIEGPSVDLAMVLVREWGNCAARADLVAETPGHFLFDGIFMDLEKGVTVIRQFRQVKERDMGKMDEDRAEDITFQIGQSKGLRNAVTAAMPAWLVDKALRKAKAAAAKNMTPEKVVEAFKRWDIDQKTLERKLGKATKRWDEMDIAELRGIYQSLLDGMTSIDNEFGEEEATESVAKAAEAKAETTEKVDPDTGEVTEEPKEAPKEEPKKEAKEPTTPDEGEKGQDITPAAKKALEAFAEINVSRAQLEAKMEKPASAWKRGELGKLKSMIKSIKEGAVEVGALFPTGDEGDDGGSWED
jgi:hypothetical protein